ncbi:hypothetical protein A2U01_0078236, partial [Trifolium medium]|nr:hypothetical protein [Trifolium medium]
LTYQPQNCRYRSRGQAFNEVYTSNQHHRQKSVFAPGYGSCQIRCNDGCEIKQHGEQYIHAGSRQQQWETDHGCLSRRDGKLQPPRADTVKLGT